MISLFLVEDERIARESIRDNVPWQEHDILFLGDAPDGEVALPQLLEKRPDILLTDIKMPFMDGLELARIVRKELPDTRIIILSGHNEFEYARKAITLGVNDYLLKPVSSRDILEAVDRSKAQILECRARRIERQSHSITQRELFFSNLYSGILMGPAQMPQRAAQLGISLAAGAYQIILTELDGVIPDREALRDKLYAAPMAYGSGFDGERATFLLLAEDAAGNTGNSYCFNTADFQMPTLKVQARHINSGNFLFAGGHVRSVPLGEFTSVWTVWKSDEIGQGRLQDGY